MALALSVAAATLLAAPAAMAQAQPENQSGAEYCNRDLGMWFYCQRPAPPPEVEEKPVTGQPASPPVPIEISELEEYQRRLERARQVAVWRPTPETVEEYYRLQQVALDKGGLFADHWRRLVWTTPELDYTTQRPVVEVAKHGWTDDRLSDRDLFLRGVSDKVGLFYVYRGSCGACTIASPIVKAFSDRYGMSVRAVSADGAPNQHFPRAVRDQGQLAAWGVRQTTPALLFFQASDVDARTGQVRPRRIRGSNGQMIELLPCTKPQGCLTYAGAGVMALEDIAERLFILLSKEPGTDF
jgi:conjugal transfer pilus assembly protein TraF